MEFDNLIRLIQELCPDGVEFVKIGELASVGTGSSNRQDAVENGQYPFFVRSKTILSSDTYEFDDESIIIPGEGGIGEIFHYMKGKYALHQRVYRINFHDDRVNVKFVYFYMYSNFKRFIMKKAVSATVTSIRKPMIEKFEIPLPPIEVQTEIVRILDQVSRVSAELKAELKAELELRKKQYRYISKKMLTFGDDVEWKKLGEVCEISRGKIYSKKYIKDHEGCYPVFSSQTTNDGKLGTIDTYDYDGEYLTWTTDGAYAGTVFYRTGKFNITNVCGLISRKSENILLKFLYYWLSSVTTKYVNKGMGNPKLMSNKMCNILIPIPTLKHQQEIISILDPLDRCINSVSKGLPAEIEYRIKQYKFIRDKLLTFKRK